MATLASLLQRAYTSSRKTSTRSSNLSRLFPCSRVLKIKSDNVRPILTPSEFYLEVKNQIRSARNQLSISALYIGTGEMEAELINDIAEACSSSKNLKVQLLFDHSRCLRKVRKSELKIKNSKILSGNQRQEKTKYETAVDLLIPLLEAYPNQISLCLFESPLLANSWWKDLLPSPLNEIVTVLHLKGIVSDGNVLLTGANLSNDYFVDRQDRYVLFENSSKLAIFYHALIFCVSQSSMSVHLSKNIQEETGKYIVKKKRRSFENLKESIKLLLSSEDIFEVIKSKSLNINCMQNIEQIANSDSTSRLTDMKESDANVCYVSPTIQFYPLNITNDEESLEKLLSFKPQYNFYLTTAYLNPTRSFFFRLINERIIKASCWFNGSTPNVSGANTSSRFGLGLGNISIVSSSYACHGFSGTKGLKSLVPLTYSYIGQLIHEKFEIHIQPNLENGKVQDVSSSTGKGLNNSELQSYRDRENELTNNKFRLLEYHRKGWTFHSKGIWIYPSLDNSLISPINHKNDLEMMTAFGSSNFNVRSARRDFESNVILYTTDKELIKKFHRERLAIFSQCKAYKNNSCYGHSGNGTEAMKKIYLPKLYRRIMYTFL